MLTSNIFTLLSFYLPHTIERESHSVFMAPFDSQRVSLFYTFNLTISVVSLLPLSNTSSHSILSNCQIGRFLVGLVYTLVELMFIRTECHRVSSVKSQTKNSPKDSPNLATNNSPTSRFIVSNACSG